MSFTFGRLLKLACKDAHNSVKRALPCATQVRYSGTGSTRHSRLLKGLPEPSYKTGDEVREEFIDLVGTPRLYQVGYTVQQERQNLLALLPKTQDELPPRRMQDSYAMAYIPLGSNPAISEKFATPVGTLRTGRLMEELDYFAVYLCYKHLLNPKLKPGDLTPHCIVTGMVDNMHIATTLKHNCDVRMFGHVTWAGRTSMESTVWVEQLNPETKTWQKVTEAVFVLIARNPTNTGPAFINPLEVVTDEEKAIWQNGEENNKYRKLQEKISLINAPPSQEELQIIHNIFQTTLDPETVFKVRRNLIDSERWMTDTWLQNTILCQPEKRNRYGKIFGGYLMRKGFELGYATASLYSKARPNLIFVDDVYFRLPVEIGAILYLKSWVSYADEQYMTVMVRADVIDPRTGSQKTTNTFNFVYMVTPDVTLPKVIPKTYAEAIRYLDGRRHLEQLNVTKAPDL